MRIALLLLALPLLADDALPPRPEPLPRPVETEIDHLTHLITVRRVYIEKLTGGETAAQIRDLIITSLQNTRLFVVTENPDRADAILRGAAEDLVYNELHESSDSIQARSSLGTGTTSKTTSRTSAQVSIGENERSRISERRHEAFATVRLVNRDGDVIWSTTQESKGAKLHSASSDVAGRIARQLEADFAKARKLLR